MRIRRTVLAATMLSTLVLTGCSQDAEPAPETAAEPSETATSTASASASASPSNPVTAPTAKPKKDDADAVNLFGQEAVDALGDEMARVVGVLLGNPMMASDKIEPADVVAALPMTRELIAQAKKEPTGLSMDSFGGPIKPIAPFAQVINHDQFSVDYQVVKHEGQDTLVAEFTGQGRAFVRKDGEDLSLDYERDYTLWLVPSTDPQGPKWLIVDYRTSDIRFNEPVPLEAAE